MKGFIVKKLTQEEFLEKVKKIHGDNYILSDAVYLTAKEKVKITCRVHGEFLITPDNLLQGKGCKICGVESNKRLQRRTFQDFQKLATTIHNGNYTYDEASYVSSQVKLKISCKLHNLEFYMTPNKHLQGSGCKICGIAKNTESRKRFQQLQLLDRFNRVHNNLYDYSYVRYETMRTHVNIFCKTHGCFSITPHNHLNGQGCSSCSQNGFNKSKQGCLYVLNNGNATKIGITNRDVSQRIKEITRSSGVAFTEIFRIKGGGESIFNTEQKLLKQLKTEYLQPTEKFDGYTECFYDVDLEKLLQSIKDYHARSIC